MFSSQQSCHSNIASLVCGRAKTCLCTAGGFEQFRQAYPHLCSAHDDTDRCAGGEAPCVELSQLSLHSTTSSDDRDPQPPPAAADQPSLRELITSSPPTLVAPYLYIGNAQNALDIDCLRTNGIRYIVNVTNNVPNRSFSALRSFFRRHLHPVILRILEQR